MSEAFNAVQEARSVQRVQPGLGMKTHGSGVHLHSGPIHSGVAGRTDHLPTHVESGSYVLPADIVSGHGEGNTINGFKVLKRMFDGLPYGNRGSLPYGQGDAPYGGKLPHRASGGRINEPVPVVLAGGEYVLKPEEVAAIGDGDISVGHRVLDDYVKQYRDHVIKTLKGLPGPRRD